MKETFLEYLNELIYMLETYEDGWWLKYVQEARQSYFENNNISKYTSLFCGMGSFNDIGFNCKITQVLQDITYEMAHSIEQSSSFALNNILNKLINEYGAWIEDLTDLQNEYNYTIFLTEKYVPGNLHEINTAYLKQSQNKSR